MLDSEARIWVLYNLRQWFGLDGGPPSNEARLHYEEGPLTGQAERRPCDRNFHVGGSRGFHRSGVSIQLKGNTQE